MSIQAVPLSEKALESKARRLAKRCGLRVIKSRRRISLDNWGDFMLVDTSSGFAVGGFHYDCTAADIIDYCTEA